MPTPDVSFIHVSSRYKNKAINAEGSGLSKLISFYTWGWYRRREKGDWAKSGREKGDYDWGEKRSYWKIEERINITKNRSEGFLKQRGTILTSIIEMMTTMILFSLVLAIELGQELPKLHNDLGYNYTVRFIVPILLY